MPSDLHIERPSRTTEKKKPRKRTRVRGAKVFDFRSAVPLRRIETTRTECGGRVFASL
jgi:hypothetical protein